MSGKIRAIVSVSGSVQGVFYRASTQREAIRLGVTGWVRNCRDGTVEVLAEGDASAVNDLIEWCRKGPAHSNVQRVCVAWETYAAAFERFEIRYHG